jgi:hypothetical protein
MMKQLFRTKKIESILADHSDGDSHYGSGLKRVLNTRDLTFFGIAAILGAGSFSSLGGAIFSGVHSPPYVIQNSPAEYPLQGVLIHMPMPVLANCLRGLSAGH